MPSIPDSLVRRQQQLVERIFFPTDTVSDLDSTQLKGLTIYQSNLLFTASRALELTYPVLCQLLGQEAIKHLAHTLLRASPPSTGDWSDWGQALTHIISANPLTVTYPFLPDIVALEWAIHECGRSNSDSVAKDALALLESDDLLQATLHLSPAVRLLTSHFPVDKIWRAHQTTNSTQSFNDAAFAEAIQQHHGVCCLLIFQREHQAHCIRVTQAERLWLTDVRSGLTVTELLDRHPDFDFINWLTQAITQNWISNLTLNSTQTEKGETP